MKKKKTDKDKDTEKDKKKIKKIKKKTKENRQKKNKRKLGITCLKPPKSNFSFFVKYTSVHALKPPPPLDNID